MNCDARIARRLRGDAFVADASYLFGIIAGLGVAAVAVVDYFSNVKQTFPQYQGLCPDMLSAVRPIATEIFAAQRITLSAIHVIRCGAKKEGAFSPSPTNHLMSLDDETSWCAQRCYRRNRRRDQFVALFHQTAYSILKHVCQRPFNQPINNDCPDNRNENADHHVHSMR